MRRGSLRYQFRLRLYDLLTRCADRVDPEPYDLAPPEAWIPLHDGSEMLDPPPGDILGDPIPFDAITLQPGAHVVYDDRPPIEGSLRWRPVPPGLTARDTLRVARDGTEDVLRAAMYAVVVYRETGDRGPLVDFADAMIAQERGSGDE